LGCSIFNQETKAMGQYVILSSKVIQADSLEAAQQTAKKYKQGKSLVFLANSPIRSIITYVMLWLQEREIFDGPVPDTMLTPQAPETSKGLATVAGLIAVVGLVIVMLTAPASARDKNDWFDVQVTGVDSAKIGTSTQGHRFGAKSYIDVQGHMLTVHANGKIYEVSSPKEMVELGPYRAMLVNKGRDMRIR
jgi:hypothetical protein